MSASSSNKPYGFLVSTEIRSLLAVPFAQKASGAPLVPQSSALQSLLSIVALFAPSAEVAPLSNACADGDPAALASLNEIGVKLASHVPRLTAACYDWSLQRQWLLLRQDAQLLTMLATQFGMPGPLLQGLNFTAAAMSNMGLHALAVSALKEALAVNVDDQQLVYASIHERLADEYDALHLFDEAWQSFQSALTFYPPADAPPRIRRKQAGLLAQQGEYRAAAAMMESQLQGMRQSGMTGIELAISLDGCAQSLREVAQYNRALEMVVEARAIFEAAGDAARNDLLTNAWIEFSIHQEARDVANARRVFARSHDLAFQIAQEDIDPSVYRKGFERAQQSLLPRTDEAYGLLQAGARAQTQGDIQGIFDAWEAAAKRAAAGGDEYLRLWLGANIVASAMDYGRIDKALQTAQPVLAQARGAGFVKPELMVSATLASLVTSGAHVDNGAPRISLMARAAVLLGVQDRILTSVKIKPGQEVLLGSDTGNADSILAKAAEAAGHLELAQQYYRRAADKARVARQTFELINRLCGLIRSQNVQNDTTASAKTAAEIELLLSAADVPLKGRIVGQRTLGVYYSHIDVNAAIRHMRAAADAVEAYRTSLSIDGRRGFDREFQDVPGRLAELLRTTGDHRAAFEALQLGKGRTLLDSRERLQSAGEKACNAPLTLDEAQHLLSALGPDSVLLDFAVTATGIAAYCVRPADFSVLFVEGSYTEFERVQFADVEERESDVISATLNSVLLQTLAQQIVAVVPVSARLTVVADRFLHNLPLHAILVDGRAWGECMSFSYAPTAAVLRFARRAILPPTVLLAGDSLGDLPGARDECEDVGKLFASRALVGRDCTFAAFTEALQGAPQIVHAALHGRVDLREGDSSGLLFADAAMGTQWVDIDALTGKNWKAPLVVFSGCSTGVIGLRHSTEMLSVPLSVLESGASTVIASLWPVDDDVARRLMTSFYGRLRTALIQGPVDLRELLDQARCDVKEPSTALPSARRRDGRHIRPVGEAAQPSGSADAKMQKALTADAFCLFGVPVFG